MKEGEMTETTDYIQLLIENLLGHPVLGRTNYDVYQRRLGVPEPEGTGTTDWPPVPFTYRPRCVYFYYVRFDSDGALRVDHYFHPNGPLDDPSQWQAIGEGEIEGIVTKLALNGRSVVPNDPPKLPDHNFENIVWNRISYIAIFADEANWKLHKRPGKVAPYQGAVVFNPVKGSELNSSFFDAKDFEIDMPTRRGGSDKRTAIYFINHMTIENNDGTSIGSEPGESKYIFDVYFDVAFADPTMQTATIILDPGGTNQGPPQQP